MNSSARLFPIVFSILLLPVFQMPGQIKVVNGIYRRASEVLNTEDYALKKAAGASSVKDDNLPEVIKSDFIINSFDGDFGADQGDANIAIDSSGNYALTWIDQRNGKREIYAQFFDCNNNPSGTNIKVMETVNSWNIWPVIAANKKGDFIIAWAQSPSQIYAQRFTKDGRKTGNNFQMNSKFSYGVENPSLAIADDGHIIASWYEYEPMENTGRWNLYVRVFDVNGIPVSDEINIIDDLTKGISSIGARNTAAVDVHNNFAVVWSQYDKNNISKIFLQKINVNGQKIGNNVMISSLNDTTKHIFPGIAATDDGKYMITWESTYLTSSMAGMFSARIYSADGNFISDQMTLDESSSGFQTAPPSSDRKNTFFVCWSSLSGIYCQKIMSDGIQAEKKTVKFNSDLPIYSIDNISDIVNGEFYGAVVTSKRSDPDIYVQKYKTDITPLRSIAKVNDDMGASWQEKPLVCFNDQGGYIILWEDRRNGRYDLYGQVFDSRNNAVGKNIQINDDVSNYWQLLDKSAKALSDGKFIIAFTARTSSNNGTVYLQILSPAGEKIGKNVIAANDYKYSREQVVINADKQDNILIAWFSAYENSKSAFLRQYSKALLPLSQVIELPLNKNAEGQPIDGTRVSLNINKNLTVFAAWAPFDIKTYTCNGDIYGAIFDKKGNVISGSMILDKVSEGQEVYYLTNSLGDNNDKDYALIWLDQSVLNIKRNYYFGDSNIPIILSDKMRASSMGVPQISYFNNRKLFFTDVDNQQVSGYYFNDNNSEKNSRIIHQFDNSSAADFDYHYYNSSALLDNKLVFAYESNRHGATGFDVWGKVVKIDSLNLKPELYLNTGNEDGLFPNVPNPFNSGTKISYQVHNPHNVRLAVYDILGREVKILADSFHEKGVYEVYFDASGLSSGIYFCRMEASNVTVNKMIIVK